jgi:hypothetical protein
MHMGGTRIEKEVEICATNVANKTKRMSTNAKWGKKICEDMYLPLALLYIAYFFVISCRISPVSGD